MTSPSENRCYQHGSALIVAMLIAAIVSLMSVRFAESFIRQADLAEARRDAHLVSAYLHGAEQLASQLLAADLGAGETDHGLENWAQQIPPLPTDNGWLQVQISDAQALFNLNSLVVSTDYIGDAGADFVLRFSPAQKQFIRLLQSFDDYPVTEADAIMMTEALIDWIDADDNASGQGGGESLFYSSSAVATQASNQPLSDVSELNLVRHFSPALVERLRPWVVVLPEPGPMNLNTAPLHLLSTIGAPDARQVLNDPGLITLAREREQRVFSSVTDFFGHPLMQALAPDADESSGIAEVELFSVRSQWFHLYTSLTVNGQTSRWMSLIARDQQQARVWSRQKLY